MFRAKPIAVKETSNYTTVYASTLTLPSAFLRNCARKAGAFLYVESDESLQTDGHWLTISATSVGKKEIRLPRPAVIRDALGGEILGTNIDHWGVDMKPGETWIFEIQP